MILSRTVAEKFSIKYSCDLENWVTDRSRSLKWHHSTGRIQVILAIHSNCEPILYHFRDKLRYWSNSAIFIPFAFDATVKGVPDRILV